MSLSLALALSLSLSLSVVCYLEMSYQQSILFQLGKVLPLPRNETKKLNSAAVRRPYRQ